MLRSPRTPLDAQHIVESVVSDDEFRERRDDGERPHTAFSLTAMTLVELGTTPEGNRTRCADQLHVAATLPDYIRAQNNLTSAQTDEYGYGLTTEERRAYVRDTVVFNHALESLIDNDSGATFNEVTKFVYGMCTQLFPRDTPEQRQAIKKDIEMTINGIRGEIIGEQLLEYLGYDTERPTVEDDMRGIDRHVYFEDGWKGVDLKIDPKMAEKKRLKRPGSLTLTVPVPDDVIGTKLRLDSKDVATYAPYFATELAREWQRYSAYKARIEAERATHRAQGTRTRPRR